LNPSGSTQILSQFDVPVGHVQKVPPTGVMLQGALNLNEGPPTWFDWFLDQTHACLIWCAVCFAGVAANAAADNVFPLGGASMVARDYMVQIKVLPIKNLPAILTGILITLKKVVTGKFDLFLGITVVDGQQDDPRYSDFEGNRTNPFAFLL